MTSFLPSNDPNLDKPVLNTAVMFIKLLVQHSYALLTADHLTLLFKEAFPESKIAKKYASCRTKTTAIISKSFVSHCLDYIVEHCKSHPCLVGTDGSNDTGVEKMNPICVKAFDVNRLKTVTTHFVDMCLTSGADGSTAEGILTAIDEVFAQN